MFRFTFAFFVLVLFANCTTSTGDPLFTYEMQGDFIIEPGLNTFDTYYFPIGQVPTNIDAFRGNRTKGEIKSVFPQRAKIVSSFNNIDWSIVQKVVVYAVSPDDNRQRKEIFYQDRISLNRQNELRLFSSSLDVGDILTKDYVNIEVAFRFREVTPIRWDARITMSFIADGGSK